ncbi:unnamed protein product [Ascophyllum nodosum]
MGRKHNTHTHNRAIRPCHPSHSMPLALILPRGVRPCYPSHSMPLALILPRGDQ